MAVAVKQHDAQAPALPTLLQKPSSELFRDTNAKVLSANRRTECAAALPYASIPKVNLAPFLDPSAASSEERKASVAAALEACRREGFMNVYGHGVPEDFLRELSEVSRSFFQRPVADKLAAVAPPDRKSMNLLGYKAFESENYGKAAGREEGPDLKESFMMGPPDWVADPNIWPDEAVAPGFRAMMEEYYYHLERMEKGLNRLLSATLAAETGRSISEDWLEKDVIGRHRGLVRIAYYPPCAPKPGQNRCTAHSDWSHYTILYAESEGLEVIQDGQWRRVPVLNDSFVINLGDQLERLPNGRFKSGIHRVDFKEVNPNGRLSFPYFVAQSIDEDEDMIAEPIVAEGDPKRFEALSVKAFLQRNFAMMYDQADPGKAKQ